eukprot:scaffold57501_cov50-Phaeocystis_antarctica.AAC.1
MPCDWMPRTAAPPSAAPRVGSSPERRSALRASRGAAARRRSGASSTPAPLRRASAPSAPPHDAAACGSHVAATARADGHSVVVRGAHAPAERKPAAPSATRSGGRPWASSPGSTPA